MCSVRRILQTAMTRSTSICSNLDCSSVISLMRTCPVKDRLAASVVAMAYSMDHAGL